MADDTTERQSGEAQYRRWQAELKAAEKECEKWEERGKKVVKRYRDERDAVENSERRFNVLWSNVQTLKPAVYGRMPKPQVERRYKDQDQVGRTASLILERCLEYEVEQYRDFNDAMANAVEDRLLPGRGIAWIRYEPQIVTEPQVSEDTAAGIERIAYECAPCDYVYWRDFLHSPARTWEEVWWVARRVYMARDELTKRFGDVGKEVQTSHVAERYQSDQIESKEAIKKKAIVYEIWCKPEKTVFWWSPGYPALLDQKPDPLQLEEFWPCPKPLFATTTTGSLVPVPDYCEYQDQAEELDILTQRISLLTRALKVVGIYNAEHTGLRRMLNEGIDNEMIPVDSWAAFADKGGLKGAVDWLPVEQVISVVVQLYEARERCKQIIYEVTGLADIIRGASVASETATAQKIKANFASLRLKDMQKDVARFATDLLRLKAQVMSRFFAPKTLIAMSGVQGTLDAQYAEQAIELLKSGPMRDFRISVEGDTLSQFDEEQEKQQRVEFLAAAGQFIEKAVQAASVAPQLLPLLGEMLMYGIRGFKASRTIEAAFEQTKQQFDQTQRGPTPEQQTLQKQLQEGQAMLARQKQDQDAHEADLTRREMELSHGKDLIRKDLEINDLKAARETDKIISDMQRQADGKPQTMVQFDAKDSLDGVSQQISELAEQALQGQAMQGQALTSAAEALASAAVGINEALGRMSGPRALTVQRGRDGKITGGVSTPTGGA